MRRLVDLRRHRPRTKTRRPSTCEALLSHREQTACRSACRQPRCRCGGRSPPKWTPRWATRWTTSASMPARTRTRVRVAGRPRRRGDGQHPRRRCRHRRRSPRPKPHAKVMSGSRNPLWDDSLSLGGSAYVQRGEPGEGTEWELAGPADGGASWLTTPRSP